jgi:hypothetical protein
MTHLLERSKVLFRKLSALRAQRQHQRTATQNISLRSLRLRAIALK